MSITIINNQLLNKIKLQLEFHHEKGVNMTKYDENLR